MIIKINGVMATIEDIQKLFKDVDHHQQKITYTRIIKNVLYICSCEC